MTDELKNAIEELKNDVEQEMNAPIVQNEDRIEEVKTAFATFWSIVDCDDIKRRIDEPFSFDCDDIKRRIDEPFVGSADIMMSGKEIHIRNPVVFCELLKQVDVAEIVPAKDGDVSFNATYYGTSGKAVES